MVRNYENKSHLKFLLPSQPNEGNFTSRVAYESALATYQRDHDRVVEARDRWKQSEQVEDARRESKAARARAAAEKERREAAERSRKRPRLEDDVGMSASTIIALPVSWLSFFMVLSLTRQMSISSVVRLDCFSHFLPFFVPLN